MFSYEEFLELREEKMRLERDNMRLKNELSKSSRIYQNFQNATNQIEKLKEVNQEKEAKVQSLKHDISILESKLIVKINTVKEINEKNNNLNKINEELINKIHLLKTQYKQQIDGFVEKNRQNTEEIQDLKSTLSAIFTQFSPKYYQKTLNDNNKLNNLIQLLKRKHETYKIQNNLKITRLTQENAEKGEEIRELKEKIEKILNQNQLSTEQKEMEINNQYKKLFDQSQNLIEMKEVKIQSLINELSQLKTQKNVQSKSNSNDKNDEEITKLDQMNNALLIKINELNQRNDKNESIIISLQEKNDKINQLLSQSKQRIVVLKRDNKEKESKIELLLTKIENNSQAEIKNQIFQLNQQIQELKNENQKLKKNYKKKIIQLTHENEAKLKALQNQFDEKIIQSTQNLNNQIQIKNFEELINKQKIDIDDKEGLINRLKIIINNNQNKINRMETEKVNLIKQIENHEENDQKIAELFQSFINKKFDLKILLKSIQESNHPLKNDITDVISDLEEMIPKK